MAVASLTPRVRTIVICDDVFVSPTEDGVFTLEGVRQHLEAVSFPWRASLNLFLLLSSPRKGAYAGKILVVDEQSDKAIRYVKFLATFRSGIVSFLKPASTALRSIFPRVTGARP